jgi:hypothetical protein
MLLMPPLPTNQQIEEDPMDPSTLDLILQELKALSGKLDTYIERTTNIEALIKPLFRNGTPGLLAQIDDRLKALENWRWWVIGASSVVGAVAGFAADHFHLIKIG